jgi:FdrA protein
MPDPSKPEAVASPVPAARLLAGPVSVVNVGLEGFAADLVAQKLPVVQVDWTPPAGGDEKLAALLAKLGI